MSDESRPSPVQADVNRLLGWIAFAAFAIGALWTVHVLTTQRNVVAAVVVLMVSYIAMVIMLGVLSVILRAAVIAIRVGSDAARRKR